MKLYYKKPISCWVEMEDKENLICGSPEEGNEPLFGGKGTSGDHGEAKSNRYHSEHSELGIKY